MSGDEVERAVARIEARDPQLGMFARLAANTMTAGEGVEVLSTAGVQDALWWYLPKRMEPDELADVAAGAAALFDELGLERYAAIARSQTTSEVHAAWAEGPERGRKRAMKARDASGVAAPDTERFVWGDVVGVHESRALDAVERALEGAIVRGELVPGARNAKRVSVEICDRTLDAPLDLPPGQTLRTMVTTERVETWISTARADDVGVWRANVANRLLAPIEPPADFDRVVAPVRWLLEHAAVGIELTQSGYVPKAMVLEGCERFGWWDWDKPPRSEADLHELLELRAVATKQRLIRKKGRVVSLTAKGAKALANDALLWPEIVTSIGGDDPFQQFMAELVGLRLLDAPIVGHGAGEELAPIVAALGWRASDGAPLSGRDVFSAMWDCLRWWRILSVLDIRESRWDRETHTQLEPSSELLTPAGEVAILAYLRERATGPSTHPYG